MNIFAPEGFLGRILSCRFISPPFSSTLNALSIRRGRCVVDIPVIVEFDEPKRTRHRVSVEAANKPSLVIFFADPILSLKN